MSSIVTPEQKQLIFKLHRETKKGLFLCKRILVKYDWDYNTSKDKIKDMNDRLILN